MTDVAPITTHPRIRERRLAVEQDAATRRRRVMVILATCASLGAMAYGVTRSPLLDVDVVRVEGSTNTSVAEVAKAAGVDHDPQLADLDPTEMAARVERLPWVATATVERHWPRTIEVTLLERTPLAAVPNADGRWALVDTSGRVLDIEDGPPPGMPTVVAPAGTRLPGSSVDNGVLGAINVLQALPVSLHGRVRGLTVAENGTLEIALDRGPPVQFGPPTQVRPKLVALSTLLARTNLRGVRAIDVRVPTAPVLTRG